MTEHETLRTGSSISEWKANVQTFFKNDWSQLRDLVLELEEQSWGQSPDGDQQEGSPATKDSAAASAHSDSAESIRHASTTDIEKDDRLDQLAKSIEERIRTNNCAEM